MGFDPVSLGLAGLVSIAGEGAGTAALAAGTYGPVAAASTLLPSLGGFATAASLAGTGISALGSLRQSNAQSAAAGYNAQVAANNAKIATQNAQTAGAVGEQNVAISQAQTKAKAGAILANEGASGVDIKSPSFTGVRSSASELGQLDAMTIRSNAARQAYGFQTQATSDTAQAALDKMEAKSDKTAGYVNAGATIFGGIGKLSPYQNWLSGGGPLAGVT